MYREPSVFNVAIVEIMVQTLLPADRLPPTREESWFKPSPIKIGTDVQQSWFQKSWFQKSPYGSGQAVAQTAPIKPIKNNKKGGAKNYML